MSVREKEVTVDSRGAKINTFVLFRRAQRMTLGLEDMSSDTIDCYLLDVIKIKISYIDVVESFWITRLASNQII